jgi:hypothetical protein
MSDSKKKPTYQELELEIEKLSQQFDEAYRNSDEAKGIALNEAYAKLKKQWESDPNPVPTPDPVPPNPDVPPQPIPGGSHLLWKSDGIWNNGKKRIMVKHGEFDPYDPLCEVRAGGHGTPRKWVIPGDGNYSILSGGMTRVYCHVDHDGKVKFKCVLVWNKSLDNFSIELFSRHDEGGAPENRRGGVTYVFHANSVESKEEYYHAVYAKGQSKPLKTKLVVGQSYLIEVVAERKIASDGKSAETDLEGFINGQSAGKFTQKVTLKQEPGLAKPSKYFRWRLNGTAPKDVRVSEMEFYQLA